MQQIDSVRKKSKNFDAVVERAHKRLANDGGTLESTRDVVPGLDAAAEAVLSGNSAELLGGTQGLLEAIILDELRPPYLIQNDKIIIHGDYDHKDLIVTNKDMLEERCLNVGRVDLLNDARRPFVGTGWLIEEDLVVTNRHVARTFATQRWSGGWDMSLNQFGDPLRLEINYIRQHETASSLRRSVEVLEILYVAPNNGPDIALLKVRPNDALVPLEMREGALPEDLPVAAVGYPAWDGVRNDAAIMDDVFSNTYNVKRFSPGLATDVVQDGVIVLSDYSSLGGNSGSAVLDLETGKVVGLHYAGVFHETNYAVMSNIVWAAKREVSGAAVPGSNVGKPEVSAEAVFAGREGYDPEFLGTDDKSVALPDLGDHRSDLAAVTDDQNGELKYTHFSVLQSKSRRLPMLTAVNIDGAKAFRLRRSGSWKLDGRIDKSDQIGNELYRFNPIDRGHMVRRRDPGWGDTRAEAQDAERDTFHYTNSVPQHKDLNQRDWVGLEDYILEAAETKDFKISVMTGPVFRETDQTLINQDGAEDVQIPQSFWKVAVMENTDTGKLSATGYVLTQGDLIKDLTEAAFVLGDYKTYQVPIRFIEAETGLSWANLRESDPLNDATENLFGASVIPVDGPLSLTL